MVGIRIRRHATRLAADGAPLPAPTGQQRTRADLRVESEAATTSHGFDLVGESTPVRVLAGRMVASRKLLVMLARKDFFVRYRRASFGLIWAVVLPLVQAIVMAVVFSRVLRIHTGTNYPTFVYSGIVPWIFFSTTLSAASTSIVDGQDMATKVYFPRAILPLVPIGSGLFGFAPALLILVGFALLEHVHVGLNLLLLVPATMLMMILTAAFSLVLSALHVYFRDVRYVVAAALTVWIYMAPVLYPLSWAPPTLRRIIAVVPTTGVVELFRAGSVGADPGWVGSLAVTAAWTAILLVAAAFLYRRYDRVFVDLL
jgi:homopolymeric O-antigen transport system permease protein